eukprot:202354_1
MAAVEKLNEMYPNLGKARIQTTLNECNGDTTATIVKLQSMQPQQQVVIQPQQQVVTQPIISEGNANTANTASTTNASPTQQVVVVCQPQPMQTVVIVRIDTNNMNKQQRQDYINQQMISNGGYCNRICLCILWIIIVLFSGLLGAFAVSMMSHADTDTVVLGALMFVKSTIAIICAFIIMIGLTTYSYRYIVFGLIWSVIYLFMVIVSIVILSSIPGLVPYPEFLPAFVVFWIILVSFILYRKIKRITVELQNNDDNNDKEGGE